MTPYETVFNAFLKKVEDFDLPRMDEDDQTAMMIGWMDTALSDMYFNDITIDSDLEERDDDMQAFNADLSKHEIELISLYMVAAWYQPRINSLEHTSLFVGASGEKWTSQRDHMEMLISQRDKVIREARKLYRNMSVRKNKYFEK